MSAFLHVRVDPLEKERWRSQARAEGVSLSAWVSARLNGKTVATDERLASVEEELRDELRDLDRRLSRIESLAEGRGD